MASKRDHKQSSGAVPATKGDRREPSAPANSAETVTITCPVCGEVMFDLNAGKPGAGFPCSRCGAALFFLGELGEADPESGQTQPAAHELTEQEVQRIGTIWEAEADTDFEIDLRKVNPDLADSDAVLSDDEGEAPPPNEDSSWILELNQRAKELEAEAATADAEADAGSASEEVPSQEQTTELLEWGDVTQPGRSTTDTHFELETPTPIVAAGNGTAMGRRQRELELRTIRVYVSVTDDLAAERVLMARFLTRETQRVRELATLEYVVFDHGLQASGGVLDVEEFGPAQVDIAVLLIGQHPGHRTPPGVDEPEEPTSGTELELAAIQSNSASSRGLIAGQLSRPADLVATPNDRRRNEADGQLLARVVDQWFEGDNAPFAGRLNRFEASYEVVRWAEESLRREIDRVIAERGLTPRDSTGEESVKWWTNGSPYRGAASYDASCAEVFEGRNELVLQAVSELRDQATRGRPVIVLSGPGASGKTSLARAGIKPLIMSRGVAGEGTIWRRCYLRAGDMGESAVESLAAAIMDYDVLPELGAVGTTPAKLAQLLRKNPPAAARNVQTALAKVAESGEHPGGKGHLLLMLDQLEELLANESLSHEDKSQFWTAVGKLVATGEVWLILIVRDDFLTELANLPELAFARVEKVVVPVVPPTREELLRIVQIPAEGAGLWFGKDPTTGKWLDQQIADDAAESPEPLFDLSLTMQSLYEKRTPRGKITQTSYDEIDSVGSAAEKIGEAIYRAQTPAVQAALPRLVRELIEFEPHLERQLLRAVPASRFRADADLATLVEALHKAGLLTTRRQLGGATMVRLTSLALVSRWPGLADALEAGRSLPLMEASGEVPVLPETVDVPLEELADDETAEVQEGEIASGPPKPASLLERLFTGRRATLIAASVTALITFVCGAWFLNWGPFKRPCPLQEVEMRNFDAVARKREVFPPIRVAGAAAKPAQTKSESTPKPADGKPAAPEPAVAVAPSSAGNEVPGSPAPLPAVPVPAVATPQPAQVASVTPPAVRPDSSGSPEALPRTPAAPETPAEPAKPDPQLQPGESQSARSGTGLFAEGKEFTNSVGIKFIEIPAGSASLGSPHDEAERNSDERVRRVSISKPFHMATSEVTQAQYEAVVGKNPSGFKGKYLPVENVTWDQAVEYCRRLSAMPEERKAGRIYRLPTEAEWEYACRAGTSTAFSFGATASSKEANFDGTRPYRAAEGPDLAGPCRCGSYKPNAFGLYDMHGNVSEWCQDWFSRDLEALGELDPQGPVSGKRRVIRGGSWLNSGAECRSGWRGSEDPSRFDSIIGFRVVCVPAAPK